MNDPRRKEDFAGSGEAVLALLGPRRNICVPGKARRILTFCFTNFRKDRSLSWADGWDQGELQKEDTVIRSVGTNKCSYEKRDIWGKQRGTRERSEDRDYGGGLPDQQRQQHLGTWRKHKCSVWQLFVSYQRLFPLHGVLRKYSSKPGVSEEWISKTCKPVTTTRSPLHKPHSPNPLHRAAGVSWKNGGERPSASCLRPYLLAVPSSYFSTFPTPAPRVLVSSHKRLMCKTMNLTLSEWVTQTLKTWCLKNITSWCFVVSWSQ